MQSRTCLLIVCVLGVACLSTELTIGRSTANATVVCFVAEMDPLPGLELPSPDTESGALKVDTQHLARVRMQWQGLVPMVKARLTPDLVRCLSLWAKKEMAEYCKVGALEEIEFRPLRVNEGGNQLLLEGTIDVLPSHHPNVVYRWLKVYLTYDLQSHSILLATITIRGVVEE